MLLAAFFLVSLAVFLIHESRTRSPFVNLELFKIRRFQFSVVSSARDRNQLHAYRFPDAVLPPGRAASFADPVGVLFMAPSILTVALARSAGT